MVLIMYHFGDKKVYGIIKNTATVATYKNAVVKVTYYSKTKTELVLIITQFMTTFS